MVRDTSASAGRTACRQVLIIDPRLSGNPCRIRFSDFALNRFVDFFSVNSDVARSVNSDADLVTTNIHDRDADGIANDDSLVTLSGKDEHWNLRENDLRFSGCRFVFKM